MRIYLSYPLTDQPFGGANQFLKTLGAELSARGLLTHNSAEATVILTNAFFSPPLLGAYDSLFTLKRSRPDVRFVHRMDGVRHVYRGSDETAWQDEISSLWAELCADGVIFQSDYCRSIQYQYGYPRHIPCAAIGNACDRAIFHPPLEKRSSSDGRVRLIYTSWSANPLKGFPTLQMLDEKLDFNRYSFTFVGNSPVSFKHVQHIPAQPSAALADLLREADVFVGLSHNEPCSNAIGEALACGLPALIRNSGGNASFVSQGAVLYDNDDDILPALDRMAAALEAHRARIRPLSISDIADQYVAFAAKVVAETQPRRPDCARFLACRKKLRRHYPDLPARRAWRCKVWLEGIWS